MVRIFDYDLSIYEASVKAVASVSIVCSAYLSWSCWRLARKRLLARQILNVAVADLLSCCWELSWWWGSSYAEHHCGARNIGFFYTLAVSMFTEASVAWATVLMVHEWRRSLKCFQKTIVPLAWAIPALLFIPWLGNTQPFDDDTDLCQEEWPFYWIAIYWIFFGTNSCVWLYIVYVSRHHAAHTVLGAHMRATGGYIFAGCVTFLPYNVYLVQQRQDPLEWLHAFGAAFLCANGTLNLFVYKYHMAVQRPYWCPRFAPNFAELRWPSLRRSRPSELLGSDAAFRTGLSTHERQSGLIEWHLPERKAAGHDSCCSVLSAAYTEDGEQQEGPASCPSNDTVRSSGESSRLAPSVLRAIARTGSEEGFSMPSTLA